jgi:multiple sugar transport system ATP-binding protein
MASVTYENVTKRFGDVTAVGNLSITIADKEFLVLVGPSGCGKTTALRLLAGLEEITEGRILIGDRCRAQGSGYCHGVPILCTLPSYECI